MCVWTAREHFGLECNAQEHYLEDLDDDMMVVHAVESLADIYNYSTRDDLTEETSARLNVPLEHARVFPKLLKTGLEKTEAILVIWGSDLVWWTKPDLNVEEIMPADWHWK